MEKRKPTFGVLFPEQRLLVPIAPAIDPAKTKPLVFTARPSDIDIDGYDATAVTLRNTTKRNVPYGMVLAPSALSKALSLPWKEIIDYGVNTPMPDLIRQIMGMVEKASPRRNP